MPVVVTREAISGYNVAQLCRGVGIFSAAGTGSFCLQWAERRNRKDSSRLSASGFVLILLAFRFDRVWAFSFGFFLIYIYFVSFNIPPGPQKINRTVLEIVKQIGFIS